jgi:methyl-accepting chemotaxis protein
MTQKTKRAVRPHSIEDLAEKLGIQDLEQTSLKQFKRLMRMAAKGRISQPDLAGLVAEIPHAPWLLKRTIKGLDNIVKQATENQKDALSKVVGPLGSISKTLRRLSEGAETDEVRRELARMTLELARIQRKVARTVERMNEGNNEFWLGMARAILTAAGLVFLVLSGSRRRT